MSKPTWKWSAEFHGESTATSPDGVDYIVLEVDEDGFYSWSRDPKLGIFPYLKHPSCECAQIAAEADYGLRVK